MNEHAGLAHGRSSSDDVSARINRRSVLTDERQPKWRDSANPDSERDDQQLVAALRLGDERAFTTLVEHYQHSMIHVASRFVRGLAEAEDVVQETWVAALNGLSAFEGRSSFRTWLFGILKHQALQRAKRDHRSIPFSALARSAIGPAENPESFFAAGVEDAGHWIEDLADWRQVPESVLLGDETLAIVRAEIGRLPIAQRTVIMLRDVEGLPAADVCQRLSISESYQRVLLHRARAQVRRALDHYLNED